MFPQVTTNKLFGISNKRTIVDSGEKLAYKRRLLGMRFNRTKGLEDHDPAMRQGSIRKGTIKCTITA